MKEKTHAENRKRSTLMIGLAVGLLTLIGFASVVSWTAGFVGSILNNTKQKEELKEFITPVVIFDPVPFNNVKDADGEFLLQASLWATLLSERSEAYTYDDIGLMLVPSTDVDAAAVRLFGESIALTHRTFDDYEVSYLFDEEIKAYHVPVIAKVAYSPKVEKITKRGDALIVKVGYVPPGNIWAMDTSAKKYTPSPEKYMIYEIKKARDGYNIVAIRDLDNTVPTS